MKKNISNHNKILLVLFVLSVGVIVLLIIFLKNYRKWKSKERSKDDNFDMEKLIPNKRSPIYKNGTSVDSFGGNKNVFSLKNIGGNGYFKKEFVSRTHIPLLRREKEYSCANNNTCCSSNKRIISNISQICGTPNNQSQDSWLHKDNKKYHSIPCQSQMLRYKIERFSPMCTSSPLPRTNSVASTNDTFSICKELDDIHGNGDLETNDLIINDSRSQFIASVNTTSSELKTPVLHSKSRNDMKDAKFLRSGNIDNYNITLSQYRNISESEDLSIDPIPNYKIGYISNKSMSPQYAEILSFHEDIVKVTLDNMPYFIIHSIYLIVFWFSQQDYFNTVATLNSSEIEISRRKTGTIVMVSKLMEIESSELRNVGKVYPITQRKNSIKTNIEVQLTVHNYDCSKTSFTSTKETCKDFSTLRNTDYLWKGRSRKTIKR